MQDINKLLVVGSREGVFPEGKSRMNHLPRMSRVWLLAEEGYGTCGVIYSVFCKPPES